MGLRERRAHVFGVQRDGIVVGGAKEAEYGRALCWVHGGRVLDHGMGEAVASQLSQHPADDRYRVD